MKRFFTLIIFLVFLFLKETQAAERFEIQDEVWQRQDCSHYFHLCNSWPEDGINVLTMVAAAEEAEKFAGADVLKRKEIIHTYINQVSYLTCNIIFESVCNRDRALIRQMIWNRISLLRMLSNPDYHQEAIETLPSLALLYDNLAQMEKMSLDRLNFDTTVPQEQTETAYTNLKKDCRSFYNQLRDLIPDDLWPVLDKATGEKAIHPYFLHPRSF